MKNNDSFLPLTDAEHLRAMRLLLVQARELLYAVDEGFTVEQQYACHISGAGMHPRVRSCLEGMDQAIKESACMIDEL